MKFAPIIVLLVVGTFAYTQNNFPHGQFNIKNFTQKEYNGTVQNWDIIQNEDHTLFFANNGSILEFNGESWSKFTMENEETPRSFDKDDQGQIFVGGVGEFGMITHDENGKTTYQKLSGAVDSIEFDDVWQVFNILEHTYFVTYDQIFIRDSSGKIELIYLPENASIHQSINIGEDIICYGETNEKVICYLLRGNKFFEIQGSESVRPIESFERNGEIFIIERYTGDFYKFKQNGSVYWFEPTKLKLELGDDFTVNDVLVTDNLFVVGTSGNGVLIFDENTNFLRAIKESDGLENLEIRQLLFDQYFNLWLCNDNGITFIETSSAITSFNNRYGVTGVTEDILYKNNELVLATHSDIFKSEIEGDQFMFKKKDIFGMDIFQIRSFKFTDGSVHTLVVANDGVYELFDNEKIEVIGDQVYAWDLSQSKSDPNRIYVGLDGDGVGSILYENGNFTYQGRYKNTTGEVRSVIEYYGQIYYSVKFEGVHKLDTNKNQKSNKLPGLIEYSDSANQYKQFTLAKFRGKLYAGTANGLYRIQNDGLEPVDFENDYFNKQKLLIHRLINDDNQRLWIVLFHNADTPMEYSEVGYLQENDEGKLEWHSSQFSEIANDVIFSITPGENGVYWFAGGRKIYAYNSNLSTNFDQPFNPYINQVSLNEDSVYMYHVNHAKPKDHVFAYKYNSVRFDFSCSGYLGQFDNSYSYYLEGEDTEWSKWKKMSHVEFQRLAEGDYVFHLKAKNYYGYESEVLTFSFKILPPWFRTWWAYCIYLVLFVLLILIVIKLSIRRIKAQKEQLEKIVEQRTAEIAEQNKVLEVQKAEIQEKSNDILDSIKYAKRIQNAILPTDEKLNDIFENEYFVLYKPKDIVSGDFFWADRFGDDIVFSAVDCTGHGVPGAFVSIVGFNGLNRTVNEFNLRKPGEILDKLTELVVGTFSAGESNIKDGMDIALCNLNHQKMTVQFAGANNPLVLIRNGEITEIKGDKQPIGEFENRVNFTNNELQVQKGDCLYVFSDGYADQFGGPKGKKLKYKVLKEILLNVNNLSMAEQKAELDKAFEEWRSDYEQLDDVCIIGVRI